MFLVCSILVLIARGICKNNICDLIQSFARLLTIFSQKLTAFASPHSKVPSDSQVTYDSQTQIEVETGVRDRGYYHGAKAACSGERARTPELKRPPELKIAVQLKSAGN